MSDNSTKPDAKKIRDHDNIVQFRLKPLTTAENLTRNELISIKALTNYVAFKQKVSEETVTHIIQSEFNVDDLTGLRREHYERAIKFLIDLQVDMLLN